LRGADLSRANLAAAILKETSLGNAGMTGADLREATLTGAGLRGADLSGADLTWADLTGADLSGAELRGARLESNLHGTDLGEAEGLVCRQIEGAAIDERTRLPEGLDYHVEPLGAGGIQRIECP